MNTFTECFKTILTGEKVESRKAARQVRKLLYNSSNDRSKHEDIRPLINKAPGENVGSEMNGKSDLFSRPALILKKLLASFFLVAPTTS